MSRRKRGWTYKWGRSSGGLGNTSLMTPTPAAAPADWSVYRRSSGAHVAVGPEDYSLKLAAKNEGWKKLRRAFTHDEAFRFTINKNTQTI